MRHQFPFCSFTQLLVINAGAIHLLTSLVGVSLKKTCKWTLGFPPALLLNYILSKGRRHSLTCD